jgi:hypothetical protein
MRRDCRPYLIDKSNAHTQMDRVRFDDKKVAEAFLQEIIHASPDLLPIERLDANYSPSVSLGREIINIDNLLISPTGRITIVETKLWRNPQATREVIAQAIDYANKLWEMEYDEFQQLARTALSPAPLKDMSLYEYVAQCYPELVLDEEEFHDETQKCLNNAEFMLLIVGDGIRENLESMTEMLYKPQLHFKFGLIEVQLYESPAMPYRLVIPNIVAQATELRRTVVKVESGAKPTIAIQIDEPPTINKTRRVLSEEEFFAEIKDQDACDVFRQLLEFGAELGASPLWRASSVGLRFPDPRGQRKVGYTLFLLNLDATVSDGFLGYQLEESIGNSAIAENRGKELSKVFGIPYAPKYKALERGIFWKRIAEQIDTFKEIMRNTVNELKQIPTATANQL